MPQEPAVRINNDDNKPFLKKELGFDEDDVIEPTNVEPSFEEEDPLILREEETIKFEKINEKKVGVEKGYTSSYFENRVCYRKL